MRPRRQVLSAWLSAMLIAAAPSVTATFAQTQSGTIEGRIRIEGQSIQHVIAEVIELQLQTETDPEGRYRLVVPAGTYSVSLRLGGFEAVERGVLVAPGQTASRDTSVDWPLFRAETLSVMAPARLPERLLETSAATSTLLEVDLRTEVAHGQFPRVLSSSPGVELTQSGQYDFNLNARGFNTVINRRVKTLIDGRDPSVPVYLGYQDWAANSMGLDEIERVEFVRGPGAALYGAGAFNGVLSVVTKSPRDTLGGSGRITFGGQSTGRVEFRHAARLASNWYMKVTGGYHNSADQTRSRVESTEYGEGALPNEVIAPPRDRLEMAFGTIRVDTALGGHQVVGEFGLSTVNGLTTVTSVGRTQALRNQRPWVRSSVTKPSWTVSGYYSGQVNNQQASLATGSELFLNASNAEIEGVWNRAIARGRGRVAAGASLGRQPVDSANPSGMQTALAAAQTIKRAAGFVEIDYRITDRTRLVVASRVDKSDLHEAQVSPRGSIVFQVTPRQNLRFSASRAFQSPSVTEFSLLTAVAPPLDLSPIETALAPVLGGTPLGFGSVPVVAAGNSALRVEKVAGFELGYAAVLGRRAYVTLDYYRSRLHDFTSNLLPQVGTPLGRINPAYGPYTPPPSLSLFAAALVQGTLQAALPPSLLPFLSNDPQGSPLFVLLSVGNLGEATTQGIEMGLKADVMPMLRLDLNYTLFDDELDAEAVAAGFSANTARHRWNAAAHFDLRRTSVAFRFRWVDDFPWSSGLFAGPVESYGVADLQGSFLINSHIDLGVDVANLFDHQHYEVFGGDLLGRRALASIRYAW